MLSVASTASTIFEVEGVPVQHPSELLMMLSIAFSFNAADPLNCIKPQAAKLQSSSVDMLFI